MASPYQPYDIRQAMGLVAPNQPAMSPMSIPTPEELQAMAMRQGQAPQAQEPPLPVTPQELAAPVFDRMSITQKGPADNLSALAKRIQQAEMRGLEQQQQGIKGIEGQVEALKQEKTQPDLMPLMLAADYFGGTNMSQVYRQIAPKSAEEKKAQIMGLENLLQKHRSDLTKSEISLLKSQMGTELSLAKLGDEGGEKGMEIASKLRNEWLKNPLTKSTQDVAVAYEKVKSSSAEPSAAGDLSLIFNYMKMLDPGSVVREGEFANAQNAAGVPDRVRNWYNKLMSGERLNPTQRQDFTKQAENVFKSQMEQQKRFNKNYETLSEQYGVGSDKVVLPGLFDITPQKKAEQGARQVWEGKTYEVRDGNWVEVK